MRSKTKKNIQMLSIAVILIIVSTYVYLVNQPREDKMMTREEKLEDFNYLYDFFKENYIRFHLSEQKTGLNWLNQKSAYEYQVSQTQNDDAYFKLLQRILRDLGDPHSYVVRQDYLVFLRNYVEKIEGYESYINIFEEERVMDRYGIKSYPKHDAQEEEQKSESLYVGDSYEEKILIPDEVAYLKIKTMALNMDGVEREGNQMKGFLEKIVDYDKLIIDIRGCNGGNPLYVVTLVSYLIDEPKSFEMLYLEKNNKSNKYLNNEKVKLLSMDEMSEKLKNKIDKNILKENPGYYFQSKFDFPSNPVGFKGKIYLLIDKKTFSAAETLASFAKKTGFATLIGQQTGGDGVSPDYFSLPISGIVVSISTADLINEDGTSNAAFGTEPDILLPNHDLKVGEWDTAIDYVIQDKLNFKN